MPGLSARARRNTRLDRKVPEPAMPDADMNQAARRPPDLSHSVQTALLADVPATVFALEPGAGRADEAVALGVGAGVPAAVVPRIIPRIIPTIVVGVGVVRGTERGGCDRARSPDGCAGYASGCSDRAGGDVGRPEAGAAPVPVVIPIAVVGLAIGHATMPIAAISVRISRSDVLAVGVGKLRRAAAGIGDHGLRHGGARHQGRRYRRGSEKFDIHDCWLPFC